MLNHKIETFRNTWGHRRFQPLCSDIKIYDLILVITRHLKNQFIIKRKFSASHTQLKFS